MSFGIALSGLNAAQTDLNVTANNIANSATDRLQESRAEFAELFAVSPQGVSRNAIGNGVRVVERRAAVHPGQHQHHRQQPGPRAERPGLLHPERRRRDWRTRAPARSRSISEGYVVNSQQQRLQVYPPGDQRQLQHRRAVGPAARDERERAGGDDDRRDRVQPAVGRRACRRRRRSIRPTRTATTRATSLTVYDSLGAAHTATHVLRRRRRTERMGRCSCPSTAMQSARRRRCSTTTRAR